MLNPRQVITALKQNIGKVIVGKDEVIELLLIAMLCKGHVLIEDVPGTGKTTLASALAKSLDCSFNRIQFTPDVVPSDVTGFTMVNFKTGEMEFHPGAIMCQIALADEINRTSPKTQSALLEVMEEYQVTVDGVTHPMPKPFMVLATQNPLEQEGTYPLPEAQVDRFMLKARITYPKKQEERDIMRLNLAGGGLPKPNRVISPEDIVKAREVVSDVYMDEKIEKYIVDIIFATREPSEYKLPNLVSLIAYGGSPRASISLAKAAKSYAFIKRRGYVIPEDVRAVCHDVLRHRIGLTYEAEAENITSEEIITEILNNVEVP